MVLRYLVFLLFFFKPLFGSSTLMVGPVGTGNTRIVRKQLALIDSRFTSFSSKYQRALAGATSLLSRSTAHDPDPKKRNERKQHAAFVIKTEFEQSDNDREKLVKS